MNGASFFVVGTSKTLGIAAVCQACAEILAVILAQNRENRGCLSGLSRDFSRDSNVCGGMNGAAACFAACLAQKRAFERQNERRRRMFCRSSGGTPGAA